MSADFLDTNVLVYLLDEKDQRKSGIAQRKVAQALRKDDAIISFQVVQETLNVITRKLPVPATPEQANRFLDEILVPLWKVHPAPALYRHGLNIQSRYRYGFYDALVIAAALEAGCKTLYSEDLRHGQKIERMTIEDPFRE